MQVNLDVVVWCTCGKRLTQTKDVGLNITVSPCLDCLTEAHRKSYDRGLDYGRKSKD